MGYTAMRAGWYDILRRTFGKYGKLQSVTVVAVISAIAAVALVLGLGMGLKTVEKESNIRNLYVQEGTRLEPEIEFLEDNFGIPSQHMSIVTDRNGGSVARNTSLDAQIDLWTPVLKKDERYMCNGLDGSSEENIARIQAQCANEPYKSKSLYCNCEAVAGNPDFIEFDFQGEEKITMNFIDLCDAPPVGTVFKDGFPNYKITDDNFAERSLFPIVSNLLRSQAHLENPDLTNASTLLGMALNEHEDAWFASGLELVKQVEKQYENDAKVAGKPYWRQATSLIDAVKQVGFTSLQGEILLDFVNKSLGDQIPTGAFTVNQVLGSAALASDSSQVVAHFTRVGTVLLAPQTITNTNVDLDIAIGGYLSEAMSLTLLQKSGVDMVQIFGEALRAPDFTASLQNSLGSDFSANVASNINATYNALAGDLGALMSVMGEDAANDINGELSYDRVYELSGITTPQANAQAAFDAIVSSATLHIGAIACGPFTSNTDLTEFTFKLILAQLGQGATPSSATTGLGAASLAEGLLVAGVVSTMASDAVVEATTEALGHVLLGLTGALTAAQYNWVSEGRVVSGGYQALTECVANYANDYADAMNAELTVAKGVLSAPLPSDENESNSLGLSQSQRPAACMGDCDGLSCAGRDKALTLMMTRFKEGVQLTNTTFQLEAGTEYVTAILQTMSLPASGSDAVDPYFKAFLDEKVGEELGYTGDGSMVEALAAGAVAFATAAAQGDDADTTLAKSIHGTVEKLVPADSPAAGITFPEVGGILAGVLDVTTARNEAALTYMTMASSLQEVYTNWANLVATVAEHSSRFADRPLTDFLAFVERQQVFPNDDTQTLAGKLQTVAGTLTFYTDSCVTPGLTVIGTAVYAEFLYKGKPVNGKNTAHPHFTKEYWAQATVNFTAKPLPADWGVDRFPCGKASPIDVFREGDFDYPYRLKQADAVAWQTFMFVSGPLTTAAAAHSECVQRSMIEPVKDALYIQAIAFDYDDDNKAALAAAETAFKDAVGTDVLDLSPEKDDAKTAAAFTAVGAYLLSGGDYFHIPNAASGGKLFFSDDGPLPNDDLVDQNLAYAIAQTAGAHLSQGINDLHTLAAIFALAYTDFPAASNPADIATHAPSFAALIAGTGITALEADDTVHRIAFLPSEYTVVGADTQSAFSQSLVETAITVASMTQNIVAPWALKFGEGVGSASYFETTMLSQDEWDCGKSRTGQIETSLGLFATLGYWWRKSYGSHWSFDSSLEDAADVHTSIESALFNYYRSYEQFPNGWEATMCVQHNTDPILLQGENVEACLLPWVPLSGLPVGLVFGDVQWKNQNPLTEGNTDWEREQDKRRKQSESGMVSLNAMRMVVNEFAMSHWLLIERFDKKIGRATSFEERDDTSLYAQTLYEDHLLPRYEAQVGTGHEIGGTYEDTKISFVVDRSIDDIVDQATDLDTTSLIAVYIVMVLYVGMGLLDWRSNVTSHSNLGFAGVFVIACAVISSLGLAAWLELEWTPLSNNVMPFITLGIGIDDMLVIAHAYCTLLKRRGDKYRTAGVYRLLSDVLEETGPSVTFTTLTNFIAFSVAATIPINVVRLFCQMMTIGVVLNYVFLMILFIPILHLDAQRTLKEYPEHCCLGKSCAEPREDEDYTSMISTFFTDYYGPFLMKPPVKILTLICGFTFFGLQLWQGLDADVGIRNSDITQDGSYQNDFFRSNEVNFAYYSMSLVQHSENYASPEVQVSLQMGAKNLPQAYLVEKSEMGVGTGDSWVQSVIGVAAADCNGTNSVDISSKYRFEDYFCDLYNADEQGYNETVTNYAYVPEDKFYPALAAYFGGLGGLAASRFVCKNISDDTIISCLEMTAVSTDIKLHAVQESAYLYEQSFTPEILDGIRQTRDRVDSCSGIYRNDKIHDLTGSTEEPAHAWQYASGYTFQFFAQYLHTKNDMTEAVGYTALGIFIVTFLFTFSWRSSFVLSCIIIMTLIELLGVIPESDLSLENGLKLNAFSLVNLCVSVGMAVEFTAHIVHRFLEEPDDSDADLLTRQQRMDKRIINALGYMGPAVVHGGVTSMISTAFLALSETAMIRQYYFFMFFFMIVIASANGLLLMPVILSFVGEPPVSKKQKLEERTSDELKVVPNLTTFQGI